MQLSTSGDTSLRIENPFQRAKIDHYLERAEELFTMNRFQAARVALASVLKIDPRNHAANALQHKIEDALMALAAPRNLMSDASRPSKRSELILIVDQDERILASLARTLETYGFRGVSASGFDEALDILARYKPDLIVSEVNFARGPVGFDLYLWIRNNSDFREAPFLFLATRVTREMLIAGKRMGVDEFIVKPLDEEVVMASILNCLPKRNSHR